VDAKEIELLEITRQLSKKVRDAFDAKQVRIEDMSQYRYLLYLAHNEADTFLEAIQYLCKANLGDHAGILLRTFFEMYITTKFLKLYPQYIDRYVAFGYYLRKQRFGVLKKYPDLFESPNQVAEIENIVIKEMEEIRNHHFCGSRWYPKEYPNFFSLCQAIDKKEERIAEEKDYDIVYRHLSDFVHFNALSLQKHEMRAVEDKLMFIIRRTSGEDHLRGALAITLALLQHVDLEYELGVSDEIAGVQKRGRA